MSTYDELIQLWLKKKNSKPFNHCDASYSINSFKHDDDDDDDYDDDDADCFCD